MFKIAHMVQQYQHTPAHLCLAVATVLQ